MALPNKTRQRLHWASPGPDRWKLRSTTYQGIADAMAGQWADYSPETLPNHNATGGDNLPMSDLTNKEN